MPIGYSSPARNLFLLGSSGAQVVSNFFKQIDQASSGDFFHAPSEIRYSETDETFILAGEADNTSPASEKFGWIEKRQENGTQDWEVKVSSTTGDNTSLKALELHGSNLVAVGKTGDFPWIAKYDNGGVIDWQSTTFSGDVEYTGVTVDSNGNYYACGNTPSLLPGAEAQAFVEKYDSSGNPGWGKSAIMLGRDVVLNDLAANSRDEVVAVGYLEDDSADKGYIVKIDSATGDVMWDRTLELSSISSPTPGDPVDIKITATAIDNTDHIYVVGNIDPAPPFGSGTTPHEAFIIKYSPEGNILWQSMTDKDAGTMNGVYYNDIIVDNTTKKATVIGRTNNNNIGGQDGVLLTRFDPDGSLSWRRELKEDAFDFRAANASGDGDQSFIYLLFNDDNDSETYVYGKVSATGNGLGDFEYNDGTGTPLLDYITTSGPNGSGIGEKIGKLSDGSVRNDTSDLQTYPFNANKLLFDDLATQVTNKRRQMDSADSFEYSGSPAIRPADFQEMNLLGDQIRTEVTTGGSGEVDGSSESKITPSDGASGDRFGYSVAVGSSKIVVGAYQDDDTASSSGSVYVYDLDGTNEVKINASDAAFADLFGHSVAVGSNKIVVGAYSDDDNGSASGSAYIYNLDGTGEVKIDASDGFDNDRYGFSVAVGDNKVVIGAPNDDISSNGDQGSVYIYNLDGTGEVKITASDGSNGDKFGISVAVGESKIVVGTETKDAVYVYDLDGSNELKITPSDSTADFGYAVAVGESKIVVGAYGDNSSVGAVYVYDLDGSNELKITASDGGTLDRLGISVAVGNNKIVAGAQRDDDAAADAGAAYVFDLDGTNEVKLTADDGTADHYFGTSVAVGGNKVVIGERAITGSGGAYVYSISAGTTTSTFWVDQSGKGNEGVVNGATHNAAGYFDFDGTNDTIDLGTTSLIEPSSSFSIEAWCWVDSLTAECTIYELTANGNAGAILLSAGSTTDGNVGGRFLVRNTSGQDLGVRDVINNNTGEWHHYVGVHTNNGIYSNVTLYVDGVGTLAQDIIDTTHPFDFTNVDDQQLGLSSGSRYLDGRIGEVRIYPRTLTAAQVFQNYNATKSKYLNEAPNIAPKIGPGIVYNNNLLLNYDFGNKATYDARFSGTYGTPTTVNNLSSSSYTGTLVNSAFVDTNNGHLDIDSTPGQALLFDYTWTSSFSIEMWIKTRETAQAIIATLEALGSGQQLSNDLGMTISRQGNLSNEMRFGFRGGSSFDPGFTFTNNDWEHYVITYNSSNINTASSYTAYKNGSSGTITDSGGTVLSGQHTDNAFTGHDMEIGEFRIYSDVLTATEISQNFNATRGRYGV